MKLFTISGGNDEGVPPVPIPNTEVKPFSADGTWLVTARESRSPPDSIFLSSSMAEHSAVNRRVVGSSPTWGAKGYGLYRVLFCYVCVLQARARTPSATLLRNACSRPRVQLSDESFGSAPRAFQGKSARPTWGAKGYGLYRVLFCYVCVLQARARTPSATLLRNACSRPRVQLSDESFGSALRAFQGKSAQPTWESKTRFCTLSFFVILCYDAVGL